MVEFDFDVEFEEALLREQKEDKKEPASAMKMKQKKTRIISEKVEEKEPTAEELYPKKEEPETTSIFTLKTTANREEQVMDFLSSNVVKKGINVYSVSHPHGMRGYIFVEAETKSDVEQAAHGIPYAKGILGSTVSFKEIEHMFEQTKVQANIKKNDIVEIISGPFKREKAKVTRIDHTKDDVVVELLEAAVPIPMTLKIDAVKVIRRDGEPESKD